MSPRVSTDRLLGDVEIHADVQEYTRPSDANSFDAGFGGPEGRRQVEKSLLRKLDLRLSFLVLVFLMNHVDRINLASARLQGFEEDLKLTGHQFNTLISIMYVGYFVMQIPSNMFLDQLTRPSAYLSLATLVWGLISISIAWLCSFDSALISRFLLGFSEAVYAPGIAFLLSRWYKRDELGLRVAVFKCGPPVSQTLGPLFASAVFATMGGKLGFAAWRWLFFIEGGLTCIIAITSFYITPDFPTTPALAWLTIDEQTLAQRRMVEDLGGVEQKSARRSGLVEALTDWTVWWIGIATCCTMVGMSFGHYFPTIAATMGYSTTVTLLLCAPPWFVGVITSLLIMRHSDATRDLFWHIAVPVVINIIGFLVAISTMNIPMRYLSLFLMTQSHVAYVVIFAWVSNSIPDSSSKRAVALAFVSVFGTFGNVASPYLWPKEWGPSYSKSFMCCILAFLVSLSMLWVYRLHLIRLNQEAEIKERTLGLPKGFRYIT
ncbi:major facilitator superfamily domain-containing protein [Scleroderma yunnanense]